MLSNVESIIYAENRAISQKHWSYKQRRQNKEVNRAKFPTFWSQVLRGEVFARSQKHPG